LDLIEHPKRVVAEQAKLHGPACSGRGVATVESAGQRHVLRRNEDSKLFGVEVPVAPLVGAAHQEVHTDLASVIGTRLPE
jgi:hypothetical protein